MKNFILFCFLAALVFSGCTTMNQVHTGFNYVPKKADAQSNYPAEPMTEKTAFNYFRDEKILLGWNLGNTLDAWQRAGSEMRSAEDVNWGNPKITQELLNGVKASGFDIVRIPVTWMGHISSGPDYHISESFLRRVAEVASFAHNAGLKVIINLHHDGSTANYDGVSRDHGWLSINSARNGRAAQEKINFQFMRVWKQIALYFRNHGDWLMFESFNEVHDGHWGWSDDFRANPGVQIEIVNQWNQIFTDTVRSTGSNNETRFLVIPAYNTMISVLISDLFRLPRDSASGRQIVTFHYYDPYEFGILGDQNGGRSNWGTIDEKHKVADDFMPVKDKFINNNIPVIIGETGAVLQLYPNDKAKQELAGKNRLDYISHIFRTAKLNSFVPVYWDNGAVTGRGEKFGLLNRTTGKPNSEESAAIISAMIDAVKN